VRRQQPLADCCVFIVPPMGAQALRQHRQRGRRLRGAHRHARDRQRLVRLLRIHHLEPTQRAARGSVLRIHHLDPLNEQLAGQRDCPRAQLGLPETAHGPPLGMPPAA
jgi:hypothetical protein